MNETLDKKLVERYPKIFRDRYAPMTHTAMCWGFDCSDGWYNIINTLCHQIQSHIDFTNSQRESLIKNNPYNHPIPDKVAQVIASQVKEKYGTLRFYVDGGDAVTDGMIRMAEALSEVTCEICGTPGEISDNGWVRVRCEGHR
jgi:hypothetical protein